MAYCSAAEQYVYRAGKCPIVKMNMAEYRAVLDAACFLIEQGVAMTKLKIETAGVIFDTRLAQQLTGGSGWRLPRRVTEYFRVLLLTMLFLIS